MSNVLGQNPTVEVVPSVAEIVFMKLVGPTSTATEYNPKGWGIVHTFADPVNNQRWTVTHNLNLPSNRILIQPVTCFDGATIDGQTEASYGIYKTANTFDVQIGNGSDLDKDVNVMVIILP